MVVFSRKSLMTLIPLVAALPSKRDSSPAILNSSYVNPHFQQSCDNVWSYSTDSFQYLLSLLNGTDSDFPTGWVGQNGWTNIAQWDYQQHSKLFYDQYKINETYYAYNPTGCYAYWHNPLADCYNDDAGWAALSSLEGYEAYGDPVFLAWAESVFEFVDGHGFIHQSDLDAGYLVDTKWPNTTLQATCNGQSMYGGVYWMNGAPMDPNQGGAGDPDVNAVSSGLFALLGAELCRITGDQVYCDRAYEAIQWIDRFLVRPDGLIYDHINGTSCEVKDWTFTYNAALYLGAYGVLGHITSNQTALDIAKQVAITSMNTPVWNTDQGVIFEGAGNVTQGNDAIGFKSVLIRNLHRISQWMDSDVQEAIRQYVNIQYWSLVNNDSNNPNMPIQYGRNWTGTYEVSTGQTMVAALDVLNALILNPQSAFPDTNVTNMPVIGI
ncbi:glycosyl hydrolase family 76-domain-containing protein [Kockovaella imperatae]|uniref:Glycosyl hydrolase family 76-domain-containing protein n=1 Tax=Kockovaella imperatae TaxID=4999 RepID=A0A1Y1UB50_9TREE|nr:glycosyl hydrolase family 76-domain-containing protein [Kockovaella imperatae]ORX35268.1 glycosyl hydrolase family 76-domain-containing protein [Kockovaella imperatae]